ncbi:DUF6182 family protein [Amycolatopsis sp. NPDC005961]|uniref:DUF6182 family protein n=1 Tax=Amycolatopsis sp. NPDC005961 TaxID=3156720 RepID=UPI0033C0A451
MTAPSTSQQLLARTARERLLAVRPDLDLPDDPVALAGVLAGGRREPGGEPDSVVAVVRRVDIAGWIRGTCVFAHGLAPDRAAAWRRSFTHTVFLAGNPENLGERVRFDHVAEDASAAWHRPAKPRDSIGLRRLLKAFGGEAELPVRPPEVVVVQAGAPSRARPAERDLYLATAGVSCARTLVHLNHLVAEAVLDGLIAAGDRLTVRRVPHLTGSRTPFAALRVDVDPAHPDRLRAFAGLTEEITDARNHCP